ncbi:MAG TPA: M3 family oligoendopeptidase [Anaerolineales bacterium]|nr:M3 family oligoendopeptidase [Anaerolineales bacterium]
MLAPLPVDIHDFMRWSWDQIAPYFAELEARPLTDANAAAWLTDWTALARRLSETRQRLYVATTVDNADLAAEDAYNRFLDTIYANQEAANQRLKEKLLASGLEPAGFEVPLRNIRADADLFRDENLPLLIEEHKLVREQEKIQGAQTVSWKGEDLTLVQMMPRFQGAPRAEREQMWRLVFERWLEDRDALNTLWAQMFTLRTQLAANAGKPDYRAYIWQKNYRFDYSPDDCLRFADAIEATVVPAARRAYARHRARLGVEVLRPWDLGDGWFGRPVETQGATALKPFVDVAELIDRTGDVLQRVDPTLGGYYADMREAGLLDLENRKNKSPGGFCTDFSYSGRPFIFMNAVGQHDDVQTLLHESGHAFHVYETNALAYFQQQDVTMEIAEVASMSMELLAAPYLAREQGGFYSTHDAARARIEHLESMLFFWPFMAVVDGFQHWAYSHPQDAIVPEACDAAWAGLWQRFIPDIDYSGFEAVRATGWQRKLHIFQFPFYYIEYGLAQLGAAQVWANSLTDRAGALAAYRRALSLGATRPLPELFAAAGAQLAFDAETLGRSVALIEQTLEALAGQVD